MPHAQHTHCKIYLHPSICSSRSAVDAIQRRTGLLVITNPKGHAQAVPASALSNPFGGAVA
ncbi:hypothetical protein CS390_05920 [Pseudomonas sp. HLS-6]|nr:hypothetical protein CS390_05920 [Pseudomonas sp. HLS-6]